MEFTQSVTYPGTVDEVVAMFLSPGYQERRFGSFLVPGSTTASVEGGRITFSGDVRPELIPGGRLPFCQGQPARDVRGGVEEGRGRGSFAFDADRGGCARLLRRGLRPLPRGWWLYARREGERVGADSAIWRAH